MLIEVSIKCCCIVMQQTNKLLLHRCVGDKWHSVYENRGVKIKLAGLNVLPVNFTFMVNFNFDFYFSTH